MAEADFSGLADKDLADRQRAFQAAHSLIVDANGRIYAFTTSGYLRDPERPLRRATELIGADLVQVERAEHPMFTHERLKGVEVWVPEYSSSGVNPWLSALAALTGTKIVRCYGAGLVTAAPGGDGIRRKLTVQQKQAVSLALVDMQAVRAGTPPAHMSTEAFDGLSMLFQHVVAKTNTPA